MSMGNTVFPIQETIDKLEKFVDDFNVWIDSPASRMTVADWKHWENQLHAFDLSLAEYLYNLVGINPVHKWSLFGCGGMGLAMYQHGLITEEQRDKLLRCEKQLFCLYSK